MRMFTLTLLIISALMSAASASAHQLSTAYATLNINDQGLINGEWQVRLYDLEQAIGVDADRDGKLRWQELQDREEVVNQYLASQLLIGRGDRNCTVALGEEWKIDSHFNESYLRVPLRAQCALSGDIVVKYIAFFKQDAQHKFLLNLRSEAATSSRVLIDSQLEIQWDAAAGNRF